MQLPIHQLTDSWVPPLPAPAYFSYSLSNSLMATQFFWEFRQRPLVSSLTILSPSIHVKLSANPVSYTFTIHPDYAYFLHVDCYCNPSHSITRLVNYNILLPPISLLRSVLHSATNAIQWKVISSWYSLFEMTSYLTRRKKQILTMNCRVFLNPLSELLL